MGIFDEIENLAKENPSDTQGAFKDVEQFADQQTGNQFDSEIQDAGNFAEGQMGVDGNGNN